MGRMRFVTPEVTRYDISAGDWVELKNHLTVAEESTMTGAGVTSFRNTGGQQAFDLDFVGLRLSRILAYVAAWSFADAKGRQVDVTRDTVGTLDKGTVDELDKVIDAHLEAMKAADERPTLAPTGASQ